MLQSDYHLISLKSPRHHVWSLFTECKYDTCYKKVTKDAGFPRTGSSKENDEEDYDTWLDHFVQISGSQEDAVVPHGIDNYNCYHPANFQSRALPSSTRIPRHVDTYYYDKPIFEPSSTVAIKTYRDQD